jgi:hypothetical protein
MKRLFLFAAMLVLGGAMAWAQSTAPGGSSTSGNTSAQQPSTSSQSGNTSGGANTGTAATNPSSDNTQQSGSSATSGTAGSSDQGAAAGTSDQATASSAKGSKSGRLPQTASPLPFLGMLGFGSMAAGMMIRKLRK